MTDKNVNTLTGKALGLVAEVKLEEAAEPIKMDSTVMLNAMANLLNDDTDGTLLGDLSEWMAERYGGEVIKPDSGGVYIKPAEEWLDAFTYTPKEFDKVISDWALMGGDDVESRRMEAFRLTIQEVGDGVYFSLRSERVAEINEAVNESLTAIGLYGKIEISSGFPALHVGMVEDDTSLFISSSSPDGLFIGKNYENARTSNTASVSDDIQKSYKSGYVLENENPIDEVIDEGRVANFAWTLHHSPLFEIEISEFDKLLNYVQLNAEKSKINSDLFRVTIPSQKEGEPDRVYEAIFHPLQVSIKEINEVKPSLDPSITIKTKLTV